MIQMWSLDFTDIAIQTLILNKMEGKKELTEEDLKLLNSKIGLKYLFKNETINLEHVIDMANYESDLRELQAELVKVQNWVKKKKKKIIVLFEGRDAAGKGGTIKRVTAHINPRQFKTIALPKPSEIENGQWYFQRYVNFLPRPGEMVFFDRSWYNRAVVEPVNNFCTKKEYKIFMNQVNEFERMILESGIILIKIFLEISKEEQARRIAEIDSNPLKKWQLTEVDAKAQKLWDEYTKYESKMFEHSKKAHTPWTIIDATTRRNAIIQTLKIILSSVPYK